MNKDAARDIRWEYSIIVANLVADSAKEGVITTYNAIDFGSTILL